MRVITSCLCALVVNSYRCPSVFIRGFISSVASMNVFLTVIFFGYTILMIQDRSIFLIRGEADYNAF